MQPLPAHAPPSTPADAPVAPRPARAAGEVHRFAFVVHPLTVGFIRRHPLFAWTRWLPDSLVEAVAARMPPMALGRITGGRSLATGQRIEGWLYSIGATPRQILGHDPGFTYSRVLKAVRQAGRRGARIVGLGAYTKVVGDAGVTVARRAAIPVTTGNSLTIAAALEAAKQGAVRMGIDDLTRGRAMVIGATGAIGSVCARLLAQAIGDVVLVSIEPERLSELQARILAESPGARVTTALQGDHLIGDCDLVVTATSAFAERVLDVARLKPGAVVCDVALPPDVPPEEVALRPDVLVIEGGEVLIPGEVAFSYDVGLPQGVAYACLAEAALLAMEGRFECYTLGRDIDVDRVKEIYRLFRKHGFRLAGLRSGGKWLTEEDLAWKRALAAKLRADPGLFARVQADSAAALAKLPPRSKGVTAKPGGERRGWQVPAGVGAAVALGLAWRLRRSRLLATEKVHRGAGRHVRRETGEEAFTMTTDHPAAFERSERRILVQWIDSLDTAQVAHYRTATRYEKRHYQIGLPVVVVTTLVGTSVFATLTHESAGSNSRGGTDLLRLTRCGRSGIVRQRFSLAS